MKSILKTAVFTLAALILASCGGGSGASSSGLFGSIPGILEKYGAERKSIEASAGKDNYKQVSEKIDNLKEETTKKLEKEAEALNGKELALGFNEEELKVDTPVTLAYKNVFSNIKAVEFDLTGNVVAAKDLILNIDPKELKGEDLLGGGKIVVTVTLPVKIEFLDKDGNVADTRTVGRFTAENNGDSAIIKAGSPIDFNQGIPVGEKYAGVESARLVIDLSNGLASRGLAK